MECFSPGDSASKENPAAKVTAKRDANGEQAPENYECSKMSQLLWIEAAEY